MRITEKFMPSRRCVSDPAHSEKCLVMSVVQTHETLETLSKQDALCCVFVPPEKKYTSHSPTWCFSQRKHIVDRRVIN